MNVETNFKGVAGVVLSAEVSGVPEDPCVLLVPGGGQSRSVWQKTARALVRAGRYVVSVDLRGHGKSGRSRAGHYEFDAYVDDLRQILSQLPSRPCIVAASTGGWCAMAVLGESESDLASGLVLVDVPLSLERGQLEAPIGRLTRRAEGEGPSSIDPRILQEADLAGPQARAWAAAESIRVPVKLVRGGLSDLTTSQQVQSLARRFASAEYAEVDRAGHTVAFDRSDLFNAVLLDFLERHVPRHLPAYKEGSDTRTLRNAMGAFAAGVTIVSAIGKEGQPAGLTANSFSSVSLDPPLVLVCVASESQTLKVIREAAGYAFSVLHIGQQPVSDAFSRPGGGKFDSVPWQRGHNGAPLISGALAHFECAHHQIVPAGDHDILIGRVERASYDVRRDPLLYFAGRYRRLRVG